MISKEQIFSGELGPRPSRPQGAAPSGVWPSSLAKKTHLPAVSHFNTHPHPFPSSGAIPRTLAVSVRLSEKSRSNPRVAHAALDRDRWTMCIVFLYTSGPLMYPVWTTSTRDKRTRGRLPARCTHAEPASFRQFALRRPASPRFSARPPLLEPSWLKQYIAFRLTDQWFVIRAPKAPHDKYVNKYVYVFFGDAAIAAAREGETPRNAEPIDVVGLEMRAARQVFYREF